MCLVCPTPCAVRLGITGANILARVGTCAGTSFVQCFAWSARAMYHLPGVVLVLVPLVQCFARSARAMYLLPVFMFVLCVSRCTVCTVVVSLVQCFAWSVRAMYLLARVRSCTGTSCAVGQHGRCTYLPVSVIYLRVQACILVQCFLWVTRAMYVSSCLDSRAVTVALLLLTWTVCW